MSINVKPPQHEQINPARPIPCNFFYMRQFYTFYRHAPEFVQQAVGQIPWGHNILIFNKSESIEGAWFYLQNAEEEK